VCDGFNQFLKMKKYCLFHSFLFVLILQTSTMMAQVRAISLEDRIVHSQYIVIGKVTDKHGFWDKTNERLNTLNNISIKALFKGNYQQSTLGFITEGGVLNNNAVHVCPSDELTVGTEYALFLEKVDDARIDLDYKNQNEGYIQTTSHYVLSVLPMNDGRYRDMFGQFSYTEIELIDLLKLKYNLNVTTPDGKVFRPETFDMNSLQESRTITTVTDGSGVSPASGYIGGTIVTNNEIIINGTGFGATSGTIDFPNADAGSGTIGLTNASDLISWSNTQIRAKIPRRAGTGTITVKNTAGTSVGTASITVAWSEICIDSPARTSTCATTGGNLRHRNELSNQNGSGGYTISYNNGTAAAADFSTNMPAKEAFTRALSTWRCASLVNFGISNTATSVGYVANDGISVVLFDNSLPANILGQCATSYSGACSTSCTNGVRWFVSEIDVRVLTVPVTGFTWNYSINAPTSSQYDFETVMLHELGHGHGLGHVIDAAKVMHYSVSNGSSKRILSTQDTNGALFRVGHSTGAQCVGSPMISPSMTNPTITAPTVTQPTCALSTGTIIVNATGIGALEYSINNGSSYQSSNTFAGLTPGTYNIKVRNISCNSFITTYTSNPVTITAFNFTPTTTDTWTGCVSTAWNVAGNWLDGSVPTPSDNVTIPNLVNDPVISTSITLKNLTLQSGVIVTVTSTGLLTLIP
jgi:hypothetical protein